MNQKEVTDADGITWTCVQAYDAITDKRVEEVAKRTEGNSKQVPIVCTPDGGAKSVRLQLPLNWMEQLPDEVLLKKISIAAKEDKEKEA
jgi:hypothetical protein